MPFTVADLQTIRHTKEKLLATAAHYDELAAKARAEAAEHEIAERVLVRYTPDASANGSTPEIAPNGLTGDAAGGNAEQGKPPGIPTVPAMILEALAIGRKNELAGLTPSDVFEFIRTRYWPGAKSADISSTMWRMWKDQRLAKPDESSPVYTLPPREENAA